MFLLGRLTVPLRGGAESSLMINIYMSHQLTSRTLPPLSSQGRDSGALAENGTFLEVFDD